MHVCVVYDSNNAVSADRQRVYINGVRNLSFGPYGNQGPALGQTSWWTDTLGSSGLKYIGGTGTAGGGYLNGYLSDVFSVNGLALSPTEFGYFNANGVWVPKTFSSTKAAVIAAGGFGTNGFALNFDLANFTSGPNTWADQSGNNNNFTANWNCQAGVGAGTDITSDSPFLNYAVMNPLQNSDQPSNCGGRGWGFSGGQAMLYPSITNANLVYNAGGGAVGGYPTFYITPGSEPVYWETLFTSLGVENYVGFRQQCWPTWALTFYNNGNINENGGNSGGSPGWSANQWVGTYYEPATGFMRVTNLATSASGSRTNSSGPSGQTLAVMNTNDFGAGQVIMNYGQLPFVGTVPAGAVPLNTLQLNSTLGATVTGSFAQNNNSNGPFVYTGCCPGAISYGGVNVTFGNRFAQSDVDFLANGFKVRSTNSNNSYGTNQAYTVTTTHTDGEFFTAAGGPVKVPFGGSGVSPCTAIPN
jgi:hypothetical protein